MSIKFLFINSIVKFLVILILYTSLIISSHADDIKDFQIEGVSIGDSLLRFYNKKDIERNIDRTPYKSDEFLMITPPSSSKIYEMIQFHTKKNDENYIIHSISGQNLMPVSSCITERDKILHEIKSLFPNTKLIDLGKRDHPGYKNSYSYSIYFKFKSGDLIEIACYDFNDQPNKNLGDKLTISLDTKEFNQFLLNAY